MRLSYRERRVLRKIARQLRREEPGLAALLTDNEKPRRADFDAAKRRRREDMGNYGRTGRRKF
jgi:CRP-like cAMP-binding protein